MSDPKSINEPILDPEVPQEPATDEPEVLEDPGMLADFDDETALEQENIPNPADESRNP